MDLSLIVDVLIVLLVVAVAISVVLGEQRASR